MSSHRSKLLPLVFCLVLALCAWANVSNGVSFHDAEGNLIKFDRPFSRIISLYPAHTENICSLGAGNLLLGIGKGDDYPASITGKPRFSYRDNTEKFLAAAPDLILIRPMISRSQPELIKRLKASGITVISLQPTSVEAMFEYWRQLGLLTGTSTRAAEMMSLFTSELDTIHRLLPAESSCRPGVYFESIHRKMKTFAPSAISIFALESAGGRNVAVDAIGRNNSNIAPYGKERILSRAEEIDAFLSQVGRMNRVTLNEIYAEPGFRLIKALRSRNVFLIEEEIVSRPTLRLLDGIRQIHGILYPQGATDGCSPLIAATGPDAEAETQSTQPPQ